MSANRKGVTARNSSRASLIGRRRPHALPRPRSPQWMKGLVALKIACADKELYSRELQKLMETIDKNGES